VAGDFDHLRLFRDIVQTTSVSRGAAANGITQSAASQHLKDLERRMGDRLLDRATRPFTLTPVGALYFSFCQDVLRRREQFESSLESVKGTVVGTVRVAAIYSVGLSEMSHLQKEFSERYPKTRLQVEYLRPEKIYEVVRNDQADLGIVSYPEASRDLSVMPWREEEMVVAAAPSHPLAKVKRVKPAALEGLNFATFDEDLPIRQHIDRFLKEQGVTVNLAMHFDNIEMVKEAIALGTSVSILPKTILQDDRLVAIPLDAHLVRPLGILRRKRAQLRPATERFLDMLREPLTPPDASLVRRSQPPG
jgi:DNA-binding transcriptional LysR family regulator